MATRTDTVVSGRRPAHPGPARADDGAGERPEIRGSEAVVAAVLTAVALLAWAALALAHLGLFSLGAVLVGWLVAVSAVGMGVRRFAPVRLRLDPAGLIVIGALAVLAAVMFLPGFSYGVTDKDPGGYTQHAFSIARTGSYAIDDPTLDGRVPGGPVLEGPRARFGGLWLQGGSSDVVVPQFYHLWPSLLAVGKSFDGERGLAQVAPLLGVLAVLAAALALRRAVVAAEWTGDPRRDELAGLVAGGGGGVLLATNMLEVWQAKYPTTEISAQLLFVGALLGLVLAVTTRWTAAAAGAGLLSGIGFLDRADGLLVLLLAAGVGATLVAVGRWDRRATAFAVGVAVVLPHAFWQAYSPKASLAYSADNALPGAAKVVLAVTVLFVVGALVRVAGKGVGAALVETRVQRAVGGLVLVATVALLGIGWQRERLFGLDFRDFNGTNSRSYDEQVLGRLAWFLSWPAVAAIAVAVAVVALRRWSAASWVLVLPLLVIFPVYGVHARNSVRLMWWGRRYVPNVVPLVLMLTAMAVTGLAFLFVTEIARRRGTRAEGRPKAVGRMPSGIATGVALVAVAGFAVDYVGQSWPLRSHSEFGGSFQLTAGIAGLAGDQQGVFLWQRSPACCLYAQSLFGGALWLERDQISAILPRAPEEVAPYVADFRHGFPGAPVFVVWHGQAPPALPGVRLEAVQRVQTGLSYWEETELRRPDTSTSVGVDFVVYRVLA